MSDKFATLKQSIAPAVLEYIRRTAPTCTPAQRLPSLEAEGHFDRLARQLCGIQFEFNAVYHAWCRQRGILPETATSWRDFPAVPTEAFKELEVTCLPVAERLRVFHSSGTSGQKQGRNWHSAVSLAVYEASLLAWFAPHVLADRSRLVDFAWSITDEPPHFIGLTPPADTVPHSSLVHMFDVAVRKFGAPDSVFAGRLDAAGAWELDCEQMLSALKKSAADHRPAIIMGTAFNFVQLLDQLAAGGIRYRMPDGSRVLETGGYKGRTRVVPKAELHAAIADHLGIPTQRIGCEYGMCELASQAYDDPTHGDRRFRFPPWVRVQVISPETGGSVALGHAGILQVFDLANIGSVAAIQTGDLAVLHPDRSFELLGRAAAVESKGCSLQVAA